MPMESRYHLSLSLLRAFALPFLGVWVMAPYVARAEGTGGGAAAGGKDPKVIRSNGGLITPKLLSVSKLLNSDGTPSYAHVPETGIYSAYDPLETRFLSVTKNTNGTYRFELCERDPNNLVASSNPVLPADPKPKACTPIKAGDGSTNLTPARIMGGRDRVKNTAWWTMASDVGAGAATIAAGVIVPVLVNRFVGAGAGGAAKTGGPTPSQKMSRKDRKAAAKAALEAAKNGALTGTPGSIESLLSSRWGVGTMFTLGGVFLLQSVPKQIENFKKWTDSDGPWRKYNLADELVNSMLFDAACAPVRVEMPLGDFAFQLEQIFKEIH